MRPNWFIALPIPSGPWLTTLTPPPLVRVFGAHDLHLTVAFLGGVSRQQAELAFALAAAFPLRALTAQLGQVVPLGPARRASALSALIGKGREEIERAMETSRSAMLDAAGAPRENRPALAHVTLARPQRRANAEQVAAAVAWARTLRLGEPEVRIDRIALYTWSADRGTDHAQDGGLFQIALELALP